MLTFKAISAQVKTFGLQTFFFLLKFMLSHLVAYVKQRHAVNMFMEQQRHTVEAETIFFFFRVQNFTKYSRMSLHFTSSDCTT